MPISDATGTKPDPHSHPHLDLVAQLLRNTPAFAQLSQPARERLAQLTTERSLAAGEFLVREGQLGDAIYLILSGRMRLQREPQSQQPTSREAATPAPKILASLGKGDLFGELAILTGQPRSASAIAVHDSHLARLSMAAFNKLVFAYPTELFGLFSRQLAERLRDQNMGQGREEYLQAFSICDFHRGEEMAQAGYTYAKQQLEQWIAQNGRPWLGNAN